MKCSNCKQHIDDDSWYCDQCGAEIYVCPQCHVPGKGEGKCCGMCGSKLVAARDLAEGKGSGAGQPEPHEPPKPAVATKLICRQENIVLNLQNGAVLGRLEGPYQAMLSRLEYVSARHGAAGGRR